LTNAQLQTTLRLKASAPGYLPAQLNTAPLHQLPPLLLQPDDAALMQAAWDIASKTDTPEAYTAFLRKYPNSPMVYEASSRLAAFASAREQAAWGTAQKTNTLAGYEGFLKDYRAGAYAAEAQNRLDNLSDDAAWARAEAANTPAACQQYLQNYPKGRHLAEAQRCVNAAAQVIAPTTDVPKPSMVSVPGGSFTMGDVMGDKVKDNELPVHTVQLAAFELGRYEVTFAEYDRFCEATKRDKPEDKGWGRGNRPAIYLSWEDATAYCNWLSTQHGYTPVYTTGKGSDISANWQANGYRLPTEAEWEYAARGGGKKVRFGNGKDIAEPKEINFDGSKERKTTYSIVGEYREKTVPVGSLNSPNTLGLHDMSGNVWEWCWDWYGNYSKNTQTNPRGPASGSDRVLRGGSWYYSPQDVRAADRLFNTPGLRSGHIGFRLARTP
jgi:formylglycine-generating enzyme required for sulfatase activity